jgi:poly(A) polymerase
MPAPLAALMPMRVGAAAREAVGGLRARVSTVWVTASAAEVGALPGARPYGADHFTVGRWRVRPGVCDLPAALHARAYPIDAFAVGLNGEIVDPLNGLSALASRTISLPEPARLDAEPSLLVRGPALASDLGTALSPALNAELAPRAHRVLRAHRPALRDALTLLLVGRAPGEALQALATLGLLPFTLPEAAALIGFHQSSRHHHKDLWAHTRQVVRQAVPRPAIRWAALLHDVAKVHTRAFGSARTVTFQHHEALSALMVEGVSHRLGFPPALAEAVLRLVGLHQRPGQFHPTWTDAAVRRLAAQAGPHLPGLLLLSRADITSQRPGRRQAALANITALAARLRSVARADAARTPGLPRGLGSVIIEQLGVAPGPEVGRLRAMCAQATRDGRLPPAPSAQACLDFLADALHHTAQLNRAREAASAPTPSTPSTLTPSTRRPVCEP